MPPVSAIPREAVEKLFLPEAPEVIPHPGPARPLVRRWKVIREVRPEEEMRRRKRAGSRRKTGLRENGNQAEEKRLRRAAKENHLLAVISRILGSSSEMEEVYDDFARQVRAFIAFDRLAILRPAPDGQAWMVAYFAGLEVPGRFVGDLVAVKRSSCKSLRSRSGAVVRLCPDADGDGFIDPVPAFRAGLRASMMAALIHRGDMIGILQFQSKRTGAYKKRDLALARRIADQIAGLIAKTELLRARLREEQAWRERDRRWSAIFNNTPDMAWFKDREGRYLAGNEALAKSCGVKPEDLAGRTDLHLWPFEFAEKYRADDREVMKSGRRVRIEELLPGRDGKMLWVETIKSPVFDERNKIIGTAAISRDITQGKQAEEMLRHNERLYRRLLESAADVIWTLDKNLCFTYVSPSVTRLLGYTPAEMKKLLFDNLVVSPHPEKARSILQQEFFSMASDDRFRSTPLELQLLSKGGAPVWTEQNITMLRDASGRPEALLGVTRDITGRKQTEEQLRALSTRLQHVREEERRMIAREIHDELGQVLTALRMDASWLAARVPKALKPLSRKAESMTGMIDTAIHSVRKLCSELRPAVLDDLGLIAALEWQVQEFQKRSGIQCNFLSSREDFELAPEVNTAVFRICQEALTNISRHAGASEIDVALGEQEGELILKIRDNGRGITTRELADPMSLGIMGMQERALLLGGEVRIEGGSGRGTTVAARIPVRRNQR